ncbi:hypothetical protein B0H13DRAFT_1876208 [Mycena leptocephala]|nr:hypothetical protein B0H13DRAFT_1876208 [Mycena leptocephala]
MVLPGTNLIELSNHQLNAAERWIPEVRSWKRLRRVLVQTTALLVQDIIDEIVGWMPTGRALAMTARISTAWTRPSQAMIFHTISLDGTTHSDKLNLLGRVVDILESSPHLASLIRRLDICTSPVVLERIAAISYPFLAAATVHCWIEMAAEMVWATPLVRRFLAQPSIQDLRFSGHFFSPDVFHRLLSECSPNLIHDRKCHRQSEWSAPMSHPSSASISVRSVVDSISDIQSIFDVTTLRGLRITHSNDRIPFPVGSILALSITEVFTAGSLCGLVDTLSELPGDGLERLRLHTDLDRSDERLFAELRAFDVRLVSSNVMKSTALVPAHRTRIIDTMAMVGEKWRLEVALQEHGRPGIAVGEMWW